VDRPDGVDADSSESGGKLPTTGGAKHFRISIKSYAVLFSCIIVVVAIGIFAASMLNYLSSLTKDELKERGHLSAVGIETLLAQDVTLRDPTEVYKKCIKILPKSEDITYLTITMRDDPKAEDEDDPSWTALVFFKEDGKWTTEAIDGWREFESESENAAAFMPALFLDESDYTTFRESDGTENGEILQYSYPMNYLHNTDIGWIHVGMSPRSYYANLSKFKTRTTTMALLALGFGIPASLLFGRMFTRPIMRLQQFAEDVAEGDLDARVDAGGSKEIVKLADTMNWMTDRLADSQLRMKESLKKEASLREKEVLLREIHHRVKNNMQILGGLIRIQCRSLESGEARDVLVESETRIRSMALLHQKLYQSDSISEISFGDYVEVLAGELRRLYSGSGSQIGLEIDVPDDFEIGLDTALPCGLIVNELVSNSFKYAFEEGQEGSVRVAVEPGDEGKFRLIVSDTGRGLPENFDLENAKSLGLRLVNMLVEQLEGQVEFATDGGSEFVMDLNIGTYQERLEDA